MLELSRIVALVNFLAMFFAIARGNVHRFVPALIGAVLTIGLVFLLIMRSPAAVASVLNLGQLVEFRFWVPGEEPVESHGGNWQTIIFIGDWEQELSMHNPKLISDTRGARPVTARYQMDATPSHHTAGFGPGGFRGGIVYWRAE